MSNAKWCDACSAIYPEGAEGSESGVGRITVNTPNGPQQRDQVRDFCPVCTSVRESTMRRFSPQEMHSQITGEVTKPFNE